MKWSTEDIEVVNASYSDMDTNELAVLLGRSRMSVYKQAQKLGLYKSATYLKSLNRKMADKRRIYSLNHDFFDIINSGHKAYWVGFLWADGNISSSNKGESLLQIGLHKKDVELLMHFCEDLDSNKPIYSYGQYVYLTFNSEGLLQGLEKIGFVENKRYSNGMPSVPKDYYADFVRGLFDGDGCITTSNKEKSWYRAEITNSEDLIKDVHKNLSEMIGIGGSVLKLRNSVCSWRWNLHGNRQISKFANFMYNTDSKRYLNRKRDRFLRWGLYENTGKV